MLQGIERLVDLVGVSSSALTGLSESGIGAAIGRNDAGALAATHGHFAGTARDGNTVRMARTIGIPLRYFVAKMFHGPFLVVAERVDTLYDWCASQKIGWQFDPLYTRMVPAHYITSIEQIGCPDPAPLYNRFWNPTVGQGSADIAEAGAAYVSAAYEATKGWLAGLPADAPVGVAFSGGVDSLSVLLLARKAMAALGRNPNQIRAFTLDLGGSGADAAQAERIVKDLGIESTWERITADPKEYDLREAITVIEDYHPLDVECAAASLVLLRQVRERYPTLKYLLDGDGGDENLKSYPLEDSDLTLSSILRNPLLYQEGWGIDAIKHSQTYSGGLSRAYVRTFAPAKKYGFDAFSPYAVRSVMEQAVAMPFEKMLGGELTRLYTLKGDVVAAGVQQVTGITMPVSEKRRFQDGARSAISGDTENNGYYKAWRVSKAWCRQVYLRQWEERLSVAWEGSDLLSGNYVPGVKEPLLQ
jgi:asparagine synthase (glutamine-hydrolysing)